MKKYTIYGNCQANALAKTLNTCSIFLEKYQYCSIPAVHEIKDIKEIHKIVSKVDLFIFIPVQESYKGKEYSTNYICSLLKPDCIKIAFPCCYFPIYTREIKYALHDGKLLNNPHELHDEMLFEYFLKNKTHNMENYKKQYLLNENLYTKQYLIDLLDKTLTEIKQREDELEKQNFITIRISNYIKENYKKKLLFTTYNHPTYHLLNYIGNSILDKLNINEIVSNNINFLSWKPFIYVSIYKHLELEFDIQYDHCYINFTKCSLDEYFTQYIDYYKTIKDTEKIKFKNW